MITDTAPRERESDDPWGRLLVELIQGALLLVVLPVAVAWRLVALACEQRAAWRWHARGSRRTTATCAAVGVLIAAAAIVALGAVLPGGIGLAHVLWAVAGAWGCCLVVLVPVVRWRMSCRASELEAGTLPPATADRVRRAIWQGTGDVAHGLAAHTPPVSGEGRSVVGVAYADDRRDAITRRRDRRHQQESAWRDGMGLVCLPSAAPRAVLLGESGSGKTTLAKWLIVGVLRQHGACVYVNAKGDRTTTTELAGLAAGLGVPCREWRINGGAPFDAWRGDNEAIITKLMTLTGPPASDAARYYRSETLGALRELAALRGTPWQSTGELLTDLVTAVKRPPRGTARTKQQFQLASAEMHRLLGGLNGAIDGHHHPHGWSWETTEQAGLIIVTVPPGNEAAVAAATLMLADLVSYKETRAGRTRTPRLVVLDESAVILDHPAAPPVAVLAEQLRSAGIGMLICGQSVASLGDPADRLLDAGVVLIAGRMRNPDALTSRAGTIRRPEVGHQGSAYGGLTGVYASREQLAHRLDPDRVRELPPGHFALVETSTALTFFAGLPPSPGAGK